MRSYIKKKKNKAKCEIRLLGRSMAIRLGKNPWMKKNIQNQNIELIILFSRKYLINSYQTSKMYMQRISFI